MPFQDVKQRPPAVLQDIKSGYLDSRLETRYKIYKVHEKGSQRGKHDYTVTECGNNKEVGYG